MTEPTKHSVELSTGKRYTSTELVEGYLDWMLTKKRRSPRTVYGYGQTYQALLRWDCRAGR